MAANIENTFSNIDGETKNSNDKNILILSMSTLPQSLNINKYWADLSDGENKYCFFKGISQLEAGTKYWMTRLGEKKVKLDRIIINASEEARKKDEFIKTIEKGSLVIKKVNNEKKVKANDEVIIKSAVDVYKEDIKEFALGDKKSGTLISDERYFNEKPHIGEKDWKSLAADFNNLKKLSVELTEDRIIKTDKIDYSDRINTLFTTVEEQKTSSVIQRMSELYSIIRKEIPIDSNTKKPNGRINIYMDAQGGMRTFFNLMFSLFSMQNQKTICIKGVSAIDFEKGQKINQIRDVTDEFQTIDLVSAVKAFSQYGRGDLLTEYQRNAGKDIIKIEDRQLGEIIKGIADAISISDPYGFDQGIKKLKEFQKDNSFFETTSPYYFLWEDIQDKYDELLSSDENDVLTTVKWCVNNKFYQQALSVVEAKMPTYILRNFFTLSFYKENESGGEDDIFTVGRDNPSDNIKIIEKITDDYFTYVSVEGKFLHKCMSTLKQNSDNLSVDRLYSNIIEKNNNYHDLEKKITEAFLKNTYKKKNGFMDTLFILYLNNNNPIQIGDFVDQADDPESNFYKEYVNNDCDYLDQDYINNGKNDNNEVFIDILTAMKNGDNKNIGYNEDRDNLGSDICKSFVSLTNSEDRENYFPHINDETVLALSRLLANPGKKPNKQLVRSLLAIFEQPIVSDVTENIERLRDICFGELKESLHIEYNMDNYQSEMEGLREKVAGESDVNSYIVFHEKMNKLKKKYGPYDSGYNDYRLICEAIGIDDNRRTVIGSAINPDNIGYIPKSSNYTPCLINHEIIGDRIILRYGPYKYAESNYILKFDIYNKDSYIKELDTFLGLHMALKQERNTCNHASERGLRMSVECIRNMLMKYIEMADHLNAFIKT